MPFEFQYTTYLYSASAMMRTYKLMKERGPSIFSIVYGINTKLYNPNFRLMKKIPCS